MPVFAADPGPRSAGGVSGKHGHTQDNRAKAVYTLVYTPVGENGVESVPNRPGNGHRAVPSRPCGGSFERLA